MTPSPPPVPPPVSSPQGPSGAQGQQAPPPPPPRAVGLPPVSKRGGSAKEFIVLWGGRIWAGAKALWAAVVDATREAMLNQVPNLGPACAATVDSLPPLVVNPNWKLPAVRLPHWRIRDRAPQLEFLANEFLRRCVADSTQTVSVAVAGENESVAGVCRPIRVLHPRERGHVAITDVTFRADGPDLYIRFGVRPRTALAYLRILLQGTLFVAGFMILLWGYLLATGARASWAKDYAEKHNQLMYPAGGKAGFLTRKIMEGCYATDWVAFRERLRRNSEAGPKINAYFAKLLADAQAGIAAEEGRGSNPWAKIGDMFQLSAMQNLGEQTPDLIVNLVMNNRNVDECVYFTSRDETRMILGGLGQDPCMFSSEHLEAVDVRGILADFFSEDSALQKTIVRTFDQSTDWNPPWSYRRLLVADPRIAMTNFGVPTALIAAGVGFFVWRMPRTLLRYPCRRLGWPTPDEFDEHCMTKFGRVKGDISRVLEEQGVTRADIDDLVEAQA